MNQLLQAQTDRVGKALVVDDDPIVRRFISSVLGFEGFEVLEAPDAAQALIAFQTGASAWVSSSLKFGCRDERLRSDANASRGASEPCGPAGLGLALRIDGAQSFLAETVHGGAVAGRSRVDAGR